MVLLARTTPLEEVIRRLRTLAREHGATPEVVEEVYRTMISRFIALEMDEQKEQRGS